MQPRQLIIALALSVIPTLPTLASTDAPASTSTPNHTDWTLSALPGQSDPLPGRATLHFEDGNVYGSDGCNRYAGSYTSTGTEFSTGEHMALTKKACADPLMRQADAFLAALKAASAMMLAPEKMVLLDSGGTALATFAAQPNTLGGTSWHVTGYNNGKRAVVSVTAGTQLTLAFDADGKLGGTAGCNRYTSLYVIDGKNVGIGPVTVTRKSCGKPAGVMTQEARYLKALASAATFRLDGDRLELRTRNGALAVTLSAVEDP